MSEESGSAFDLVVVGGGPGGYVAAIRARQLGMRVALVEREHLGGICLNWGCIPTKALLRTSEVHHLLQNLDDFGLSARDIRVDLPAIVKRSRGVADRLQRGVRHLLAKNEVELFTGHARLAGSGTLEVSGEGGDAEGETRELRSAQIILATGAKARSLPGVEPDGERIWTYKEAMVPETLPESLLIVGSGSIGVEFASFYRDLGSQVTVVELLPRILPAEDEEISALARKLFEREGIRIHTDATLTSLERRGDGVEAQIEISGGESQIVKADRVILAVGIEGNTAKLGLEGTGVVVERGHIATDAWGATGESGVWAIGDVAGPPWLAHKASHEGVLCVERIAGVEGLRPLDPKGILNPGRVFPLEDPG